MELAVVIYVSFEIEIHSLGLGLGCRPHLKTLEFLTYFKICLVIVNDVPVIVCSVTDIMLR